MESAKGLLDGYKGFWCERFSFLGNYSRFIKRDGPLPSWSESDVEEFIASDPVHGPILKTARHAAKYGVVGSLAGAVTTAGWAWRYSKSPHGAALSLAAGGIFGWTFGHEIANHHLQLYRLDTLTAQTKFMEWWQKKALRIASTMEPILWTSVFRAGYDLLQKHMNVAKFFFKVKPPMVEEIYWDTKPLKLSCLLYSLS